MYKSCQLSDSRPFVRERKQTAAFLLPYRIPVPLLYYVLPFLDAPWAENSRTKAKLNTVEGSQKAAGRSFFFPQLEAVAFGPENTKFQTARTAASINSRCFE